LTIGELEDGCREVIKISLTFPKPAEIIAAARECTGEGFSGPPLLDYQDITDAEREAAFAENAEFTAKLKAQLGVGQVIKSPTPGHKITIVPPTRSLEEQKAELVRRGFLTGTPHHPGCLCPDCQKRRCHT